MRKTLAILLIFTNVISYAQTNIQGKVIDAKTKLGLPYVNIGIPETFIGTISNKEGVFKLQLNKNVELNDSIRFSFIGYKPQMIPITSLSNHSIQIEMVPQINQLQKVVLSNEKPKNKIVGRSHTGTKTLWYNFYTAGEEQKDRLSKEVGMKFNLRGNYRLNSLNFYIGQNEYNSVKFRMNIYRLENNVPVELLNKNNIVFEVENINSKWFKVDLNSYNIYLKKELKAVAVSIQWLDSEKKKSESKFFSIPIAFSPFDTMYSREKGMARWKTDNVNMSFYLDVDSY